MITGAVCLTMPRRMRAMDEERHRQAEANRKREERNRRNQEKAAARREEKRREEARLHREHLARIAGLKTVKRQTQELNDKGLDPRGTCVRLLEHTDTLEDGSVTTRWSVEIYGGEDVGDVSATPWWCGPCSCVNRGPSCFRNCWPCGPAPRRLRPAPW